MHEDLAEILQVSRTPVREALERLYQEGFVTRLPRRGFYVTGITRDEAFGLYGTREALELFALQVTLERGPLPGSSIDRLWPYVRKYEELAKVQALTERIVADALFHLELADLSGNRYLVRLLAQTFERLALKRRHEGYRSARSKAAKAEHVRLMEALTRYDKPAARRVLRKHILSAATRCSLSSTKTRKLNGLDRRLDVGWRCHSFVATRAKSELSRTLRNK